jgi:hypothetical protein
MPPTTALLNVQLGYMGILVEADNSVLDGEDEANPASWTGMAKILLKSLSHIVPGEDSLEVGISTPNFVSGWTKAK